MKNAPTIKAPADPGAAAFERALRDGGEWRARLDNLAGLVGHGLLRVGSFSGEYRIETVEGDIVGPQTRQDGFNGSLLLALRTLGVAPETDSLGYVWATRETAERCLRVYAGRS